MTMNILWFVLILMLCSVLFLIAQMTHFALVLRWSDGRTKGTSYCGQPAKKRRRFKRLLQLHGLVLKPTLMLLSRRSPFQFPQGSFHFRGIAGPQGACDRDSFERGTNYQPVATDIFVATQMRCGTTWMQHLVLQVLTQGQSDLPRDDTTLNSVSPWLESNRTVSVPDAPLIGSTRPSKIIKTHFPAALCPFNASAKYIYVTRHPVSCFVSCVDFVQDNLGAFAPSISDFEQWFLGHQSMWWGTWTAHVTGWLELAQQHSNVLVVRYEDMKRSLGQTAQQVAAFLGTPPLQTDELSTLLKKCSFEDMRRHADLFEMHSPHLLQCQAGIFKSGTADRYLDVPEDMRTRILSGCRREWPESGEENCRLYPELASPAAVVCGPQTESPAVPTVTSQATYV